MREVKSVSINAIELPIEQRNTGKGNPNAVLIFDIDLNNRQTDLLNALPNFNSWCTDIDIYKATQLAKLGYRWSGHTHPGLDFLSMQPSDGDYAILECFKQRNAVIYNSKGDFRTFEKRS